jgi:Zinc carboxypeptidase
MNNMHKIFTLLFTISILITQNSKAQKNVNEDLTGIRAIGSPANPKVEMSWRKYHDFNQIDQFQQDLQKAFPNLIKIETIGKSYEGRNIYALHITDFKVGNAKEKPAFYIDGGIHANELNGVQVCLYTAWYLCENYDNIPFIKQLLQDKIFYILPNISPDSREHFIYKPNNSNSSRSGQRPFDNDGDGSVNEDIYNDLDNDGNITMMRRKSKTGKWKQDPKYPNRMFQVKGDELGEYEMLGYEGTDMDGDGLVNEDTEGGYDPNRDWAWNWQPAYVQNGAIYYPGTLPETRAVKDFVVKNTNIAGAQSYHNYGGMFLRGPGAKEDENLFTRDDIEVYDNIGKIGEKMIPGYNYYVLYKDLYTVYGGEIDFLCLGRGIFTFSNELMTSYKLFNQKSTWSRWDNDEFNEFDKLLLFGDGYVDWKPFNHPQYGAIEIGGAKKNYIRNHPGFMLEEDAHRNMAFTLYHAYQTPKLEVVEVKTQKLEGNLTAITATVMNKRLIPTHSSFDLKNKISPPNTISINGVKVIAGMQVENEDLSLFTEQKINPEALEIKNIGSMEAIKVRWIISGNAQNATINIKSSKAGKIKHVVK